jgi:23S rRNA (adenine2503-C2)-methyltransferase
MNAVTPAMAELTAAERDRILAKAALFNPPPITTADGRRELVGLTREELVEELAALGEKPFAPSSSGTGSTTRA